MGSKIGVSDQTWLALAKSGLGGLWSEFYCFTLPKGYIVPGYITRHRGDVFVQGWEYFAG